MLVAILAGFFFESFPTSGGAHGSQRSLYWLLLAADIGIFLLASALLVKLNRGGTTEKAKAIIALSVLAIIAAGVCILSSMCAGLAPHDNGSPAFVLVALASLGITISCVVQIARLSRKKQGQ